MMSVPEGWQLRIFTDPVAAAAEHLQCPICHSVMRDATSSSSCDHAFCKECLNAGCAAGCPICRREVFSTQPHALQGAINALEVRCDGARGVPCPGAGWIGRLDELAAHRAQCVACQSDQRQRLPLAKMDYKGLVGSLKEHQDSAADILPCLEELAKREGPSVAVAGTVGAIVAAIAQHGTHGEGKVGIAYLGFWSIGSFINGPDEEEDSENRAVMAVREGALDLALEWLVRDPAPIPPPAGSSTSSCKPQHPGLTLHNDICWVLSAICHGYVGTLISTPTTLF